MPPNSGSAHVVVTLPEIFKQVQETDDKVDKLTAQVGEMVAVNRRLNQHHERLNDHGSRISVLETQHAIHAATAPRKAPWYNIVGGIVGIGTGIIMLITLVQIANQLPQ